MEWISTDEVGNKWGIKARQVQSMCAKGKIDGAVRFGRVWMIPIDAAKPPDGRVNNGRKSIRKPQKHGI